MKNRIILIAISFVTGMILMYFLKKNTIEEIKVPFYIDVPVPVFGKEFQTVFNPSPLPKINSNIKEIDTFWYNKYQNLKKENDSLKLDSLYKKAIEINRYHETVEDDTIKINLQLKTRGELLEYKVGYRTKPFTIPLDTVITVKIPKKPEFYLGGGILMPFNESNLKPSIVPELNYINKHHNKLYSLEADFVNKGAKVGVLFRF